jgi:hypothetical protein
MYCTVSTVTTYSTIQYNTLQHHLFYLTFLEATYIGNYILRYNKLQYSKVTIYYSLHVLFKTIESHYIVQYYTVQYSSALPTFLCMNISL